MSDLTAAQLHAALRHNVNGGGELAAVILLATATPHVLTPNRPDVIRHVDAEAEYARIDWSGLKLDIDRGCIPLSRGERRIVDLAISLALPGATVALGEALTGLDDVAAAAVMDAISWVVLRGGISDGDEPDGGESA